MSEEVLSENEVDALMETSGDDEVFFADDSAREYRRFDITAREQGTVNRMGALAAILERQDELIHHGLVKRLSTDMAVKCQAPRVFSASEAIAALPEGLVLVTLNLKPVAGQRVAGKLSELYLQSVIDAFKEKITFETEVIDTQNNLDALEERVATEKYLALVTDVSTPDFEDALRLFVPFESFESFEDQLAGPKQESGVSLEGEWQVRMAEQMQDVAVEVSGVLASIELPLREVLGLKVGDVIDLAQLGSVSLEVQNQSVGFGQFGVFDDKKSVKYGMTGLLDLGAGVTLSSAVDQALNEETGNE